MKPATKDAKIYAVINYMKRVELGAVILGAGYALPGRAATIDTQSLRNELRRLYDLGAITAADILAEHESE